MSDPSAPLKTAVIIEDDPEIRHLIVEVLEAAGFSTVSVGNGIDGVRAVASYQPSITTLDVNMPGIDGFAGDHRAGQEHSSSDEPAREYIDASGLADVMEHLAASTSGPIRMTHTDAVAFTPDEQPVLCRLVEEGRGLYGLHEFDAASSRTLEVAQWAAMGESQRLANHIPNEFVCYGTDLVLANTEWGGDEGRYAVLRDPVVVRAFVELFDRLWAASTTVDDGVDTTSERLVELMQAGLKDEAIARVLGVSLRTVRRRIAALMDECDVETRFQLAVELTERGIVGSGQRRSSGA